MQAGGQLEPGFWKTRANSITRTYRLRYLLAWDHGLTRAVLAVRARALLGFCRRQAHSRGIRGGRTSTLTVIQRFGSGLNLNVHFHTRGWGPTTGRVGNSCGVGCTGSQLPISNTLTFEVNLL